MVNQAILEYLRSYSSQYDVKDMKQKILSSGYSEKDFDEALLALKSEAPEIEYNPDSYSPGYSRWLKIAGICGIIMLVFLFASSISVLILPQSSGILSMLLMCFSFVFLLSSLFFFYGFVALGKKYGKKFIQVISWIIMIFGVLGMIALGVLIAFPNFLGEIVFLPLLSALSVSSGFWGALMSLGIVLIFLVILYLICSALGILFGISLIILKDARYSKVSGILSIIGFSLLIFGIGILILLVSFIFEIAMLFSEGKRKNSW